MLQYTETDGATTFLVKVIPRASRSSVAGTIDGALRVRVCAPPVDGAANEELMRFLSRALDVAMRDVEIISGHTSKTKRVCVRGINGERLISIAVEK